jgi:hypothetical protein
MVIKRNDINIKSLHSKGCSVEDSRGQGVAENDRATWLTNPLIG